MAAAASYVVAAIDLLNEYPAPRTPLVVAEQFLEIRVAWTPVLLQLTLPAKPFPAIRTLKVGSRGVDDSLAVVGRTQSEVGVADSLFPQLVSPEPFLRNFLQLPKRLASEAQQRWTAFLRTADVLHDVDFVLAVFAKALEAEKMGAVAN